MNKFLKTLSVGLIMSGVVLAQENTTKSDVFKANNSLPPTPEDVFKVNNSLPPCPEDVFKANNSLPPTPEHIFKANNSLPPTPEMICNTLPPSWEIYGKTHTNKMVAQNKAFVMRYYQMQRQHTRV